MRSRLLISTLFLVGMTMSVAASSYKPPTEVKRDAGVTKVEKFNDLFNVTSLVLTAPYDLVVEVAAVLGSNGDFVSPESDLSAKTELTFLSPAYSDDHPVVTGKENSYHNLALKKNFRPGWQKKIYLHNCAIRQCSSDAVAAA